MTTPGTDSATLAALRWNNDRAWAWHRSLPWLVGGNFTPSTASNQLEMWQAETFDPATIDRELGWAAAIGMTSMRVFLHDVCWETNRTGFLHRVDQFLSIAARHGIGALLVFFDSCWHPVPVAGPQEEPLPHVHNSRWLQSPGAAILRDRSRFAELKGYVQGVLTHFRDDSRIHGWDLWNEPDNTNEGKPFDSLDLASSKAAAVEECLALTFAWAREVNPSQPLTSGIWNGEFASADLNSLKRLQIEASDIISFHRYADATTTSKAIADLLTLQRPLWCTEYMARTTGSTFQTILPLFAEHRIAAYQWGLVDGRTQTKFPWDSWKTTYSDEPPIWFHEVFRRDGTPYNAEETALISRLTSAAKRAHQAKV